MKILFRKPSNQPLELMEIENSNEAIYAIMNCETYQVITIRPDILCLCDEDGIAKDLSQNYWNDRFGMILGNVIFCGMDGDEYASLTDEQIDFTIKYIGFPMIQKIN